MKKPKMRLTGYDLRKVVNGRTQVVETLAPEHALSDKINFHGLLISLHDTEGLASIARGRGCKLVPRYTKA